MRIFYKDLWIVGNVEARRCDDGSSWCDGNPEKRPRDIWYSLSARYISSFHTATFKVKRLNDLKTIYILDFWKFSRDNK